MDTITIGKTVYTVEQTGEPDAPYLLRHTQKNGKVKELCLLRNVPRPELMFAVVFPGIKPTRLWFSDKDGTLREAHVI